MNKYTVGLVYEIRDKSGNLLALLPLLVLTNKDALLCFNTYNSASTFSLIYKNEILEKLSDTIDTITSITIDKNPIVIELFDDDIAILMDDGTIVIRDFNDIDAINENIFDYFHDVILYKNVFTTIGSKYYYGVVRKTDNGYVLDDDNNFVYDFKSDEDCVLISANIARSIGAKALVSRLDNNI